MAAEQQLPQNPHPTLPFYTPHTGIYTSKHPSLPLPRTDVVSLILSHLDSNSVPHSALIDSQSDSSIQYPEITNIVKSIAFGLSGMGFSKGDVVLILLPNSIRFPVLVLGALFLGAIVSPMNPLSSGAEIEKQVIDTRVRFCFATEGNAEKVRALGVRVIVVPDDNVRGMDQLETFSEFYGLISSEFGTISGFGVGPDDVAAVMCSSGTTGRSKGVVITHQNFVSMVELFVRFEALQYEGEDSRENVYLAVVPMFHIYGMALFVMGLLSLGSRVVVMRRFGIKDAVRAIDRFGVTHFPVVPPMLVALTEEAKGLTDGGGLGSLRQVSCGAAATSWRAIEDFVLVLPCVDFIQGYGMTETTAVGTRGFNTAMFRKYTSVGLLAPNTQARVVDVKTGSFMPPGEAGELWLRGPGVMRGYLNDQDATAAAITEDGWLRTGDIGYFDNDAYLYIIDRLKDIIKYKGFQIAPADLETVLLSHPYILDAAVIGTPDTAAGEIPVAFLVKRPGSVLSQDAVIQYVAKQVAPYKKIRRVIFVPSIPKSAAGKVLRRQLRDSSCSKL